MTTPLLIEHSVKDYECWLGERLTLVRPDLKLKRQKIAKSPLAFLRGTFFRWVELWPYTCKELDRAPRVLGVGALHLENFGTWRDADARLAWASTTLMKQRRYPTRTIWYALARAQCWRSSE